MKLNKNNFSQIIIIFLISLVVRLILLPFAQTVDADAVSRVYIAYDWLKNPHLITSGIWAPLHHYINAFAIFITSSLVYGPIVFHILFASFTVFPIYYFTKREFNEKGALYVALIYSLSPIVFRNSYHTLAEVPYGFFLATSLNFLSLSIRSDKKIKYSILAGLFITVTGGLRYEAWVITGLFTIILLIYKQWKAILFFLPVALIFPVFWMIGNYIEYKDFLYGINGAYNWNIVKSGVNNNIDVINAAERVIFFIVSVFLSSSPIIAFITLGIVINRIYNNRFKKDYFIWAILFIGMMCSFTIKAIDGTLLMQHRFTITLLIFYLPYFSLLFDSDKNYKLKKYFTILTIVSLIPLSFYWHQLPVYKAVKISNTFKSAVFNIFTFTGEQTEAVPYIEDKQTKEILEIITQNKNKQNCSLFLDFIGWDNTYYIALNSNISPENIYIIDGASSSSYPDFQQVKNKINNSSEGYFLIKYFSKFSECFKFNGKLVSMDTIQKKFFFEKLFCKSNITLFKYSIISDEQAKEYITSNPNPVSIYSPIKDVDYYISQIKSDPTWYEDVKRKAKERNISLDEMLKLDAKYMVGHQNEK
ncbi:MAG TPA: glycosyltransferase family 39 protein [Bacteroidales bacterium]|nr:glycosyltransferase family 39 protein [Bacteroidales bacterium]HPS16823.1 glycosyltransferase family 39 protein [Bacteroidales bacterium]